MVIVEDPPAELEIPRTTLAPVESNEPDSSISSPPVGLVDAILNVRLELLEEWIRRSLLQVTGILRRGA
jgi:hypothetical protein